MHSPCAHLCIRKRPTTDDAHQKDSQREGQLPCLLCIVNGGHLLDGCWRRFLRLTVLLFLVYLLLVRWLRGGALHLRLSCNGCRCRSCCCTYRDCMGPRRAPIGRLYPQPCTCCCCRCCCDCRNCRGTCCACCLQGSWGWSWSRPAMLMAIGHLHVLCCAHDWMPGHAASRITRPLRVVML
jgi:hypothetical protein